MGVAFTSYSLVLVVRLQPLRDGHTSYPGYCIEPPDVRPRTYPHSSEGLLLINVYIEVNGGRKLGRYKLILVFPRHKLQGKCLDPGRDGYSQPRRICL